MPLDRRMKYNRLNWGKGFFFRFSRIRELWPQTPERRCSSQFTNPSEHREHAEFCSRNVSRYGSRRSFQSIEFRIMGPGVVSVYWIVSAASGRCRQLRRCYGYETDSSYYCLRTASWHHWEKTELRIQKKSAQLYQLFETKHVTFESKG